MKTLIVLGLLLAAPAWGYDCDGIERRCTDLGDDCICSEPLNTDETLNSGNQNPDDTTAKQCDEDGDTWEGGHDAVGDATPAIALPEGAHPTYVSRIASDRFNNNGVRIATGLNESFAEETICSRHYYQWEARTSEPTNLKLNKQGDSTVSHVVSWQMSLGPNVFPKLQMDVPDSSNNTCPSPNTAYNGFNHNTCRDSWCRVEVCADEHEGQVSIRARIVQVGGDDEWRASFDEEPQMGENECLPTEFDNLSNQVLFGDWNVMIDNEGESDTDGASSLSHIMATKGNYDPDFWIGPAIEFELADNCSGVSNPGADQCDTDEDGYGNFCDGDFDNDYSVGYSDGATILGDYGEGQDGLDQAGVGTDMDCDGYVLQSDYTLWQTYYQGSTKPGSSALPCAGTVPCP